MWPLVAIVGVVAIAGAAVTGVSIASSSNGGGAGSASSSMPDTAALAGPLADQDLAWEDCQFGEGGAAPLPGADLSNVQCATIQVPRDWHDPDPELTWELRISQARNIDPTDSEYNTTVIAHPGGPTVQGLSYSTAIQMYTPELRPTTNYVSFDQRGLGLSSHAECEYAYDPSGGPAAEVQAIGEACSQDPDVATITTEQTAYDMDFIRHLLGIEAVAYIGYSYGTWLGTWYGTLFADNIDRMVLDSATDSTQVSLQALYNSAHEGRDRQFRLHLMNWLARQDATYGLGTDPEAIWARYFAATRSPEMAVTASYAWTATGMAAAISDAVGYPFAGDLIALIIAEGESGELIVPADAAARIVGGMARFDESRRAAAQGVLTQLTAPIEAPEGPVTGTYDQVIEFTRCTDGQWDQGLEYWTDFNERTAEIAPFSAQLGLLSLPPTCAFWPTDSEMPRADDGFPETIVLQSELDSMTPLEQGRAAGTGLPNTTLIAVDNENRHGVFPYGTKEVDRPVIDFLAGGERPRQTIVADATPMPMEQSTFESWTALNEDAEHDSDTPPQFTDPTLPAKSGE